MTTTVTINAHCASNKEVSVKIHDHVAGADVEIFTLQDGEKADRIVYEGREISVLEVIKAESN
jgi:phosphoribosylpyrophosphate synthetase